MNIKRKIDKVIIHCAATRPSMDIGAKEIREWHIKQRKWSDIGYHYVIRRNGELEDGRPLEIAGAHTQGHNAHSIGICLVGGINDARRAENNFTPEQWRTLERILRFLKSSLKGITIHGHNEFAKKACPSFDVQKWLKERKI